MNKRIKLLRVNLSLSQDTFGARIGVTRGAISRIETNTNGVTEQMILSICREFNVNENWLRNGEGDMFIELSPTELTTKIIGKVLNTDNDFIKNFYIALGELSLEDWSMIERFIEKLKK